MDPELRKVLQRTIAYLENDDSDEAIDLWASLRRHVNEAMPFEVIDGKLCFVQHTAVNLNPRSTSLTLKAE